MDDMAEESRADWAEIDAMEADHDRDYQVMLPVALENALTALRERNGRRAVFSMIEACSLMTLLATERMEPHRASEVRRLVQQLSGAARARREAA